MNETLTGKLLVASSLTTDPVYSHGVCLVVHQDESSVIGVMLNRPMKPSAEALLAMLPEKLPNDDDATSKQPGNRLSQFQRDETDELLIEDTSDEKPSDASQELVEKPSANQSLFGNLHFGGPRSGPVVAIHQTSQYAEAETGEGIYVAAQRQHLEELVRDHPAPYRLIVGHLGWETRRIGVGIERGDLAYCSRHHRRGLFVCQ